MTSHSTHNSALHIATYNIHKGVSHFKRRMVVHQLRDSLRALDADIVFLQEVVGHHKGHASRFANWPDSPQHEFLAGSVWTDFAYGKNAVYDEGHHGNAILSRYPITRWDNVDVSAHRFESRGLLHCEIDMPDWPEKLHCICVHLGLFRRGQAQQLQALEQHIERLVPQKAPLVIAGDFNDWREMASRVLVERLNLSEAFELTEGRAARTFPSALPLFRLDRIYVRGFQVEKAQVHQGRAWSKISDHAVLSARVIRS
jgi:endonuclease/exonuclease/phosphatase family metal-dependent hydrolase